MCIIVYGKPELYTAFGFKVVQEYLMTIPYDKNINNNHSLLKKLDFYNIENRQLIHETIDSSQDFQIVFNFKLPSFILFEYV